MGKRSVSILVFLDTSVPGLPNRQPSEFHVLVSILVFLDTSVPGHHEAKIYKGSRVSILVFLDTSVPGKRIKDIRLIWDMFQSLFFWIPLFREKWKQGVSTLTSCFNPCFSGYLCSGKSCILPPFVRWRSFNPCFSGYLCSGAHSPRPFAYCCYGFNPCFSGYLCSGYARASGVG